MIKSRRRTMLSSEMATGSRMVRRYVGGLPGRAVASARYVHAQGIATTWGFRGLEAPDWRSWEPTRIPSLSGSSECSAPPLRSWGTVSGVSGFDIDNTALAGMPR
jgi:hypothetical protein